MAFGFNAKLEVPKIEVPKVDLAAAVGGAVAAATNAVASVAQSVEAAASSAVGAAVAAVSLSSVAGAIADVDVSFKGGTADFAMEPHMVLDANASYGETKFEKGPIVIRMDMSPEEAKASPDVLHLFSDSGDFNQRQKVSDFAASRETTIDLRFEGAPMSASFSLEIISGSNETDLLFSHITYGDLRNMKSRI